MKNIIPESSILEITPTNIRYTHKNEEINKTFRLTKEKLKNNLLKMDFSECEFANLLQNCQLEKTQIPPVSFVFFKLFAQKTKIPHPKNITDTYLNVFCEKIEEDKYQLKNSFIIEKQIQFTYNDLFKYICRHYNSYNSKLLLIAGLSKNNLDLDIYYEYKNEMLYNIDICVVYKEELFLLTSCKNIYDVNKNQKYLNELMLNYKNIHVISIYTSDKKFVEKTNKITHLNDVYDDFIFEKIKKEYNNKKNNISNNLDNIPEIKLDFENEPFYIVGLKDQNLF